MLWSPQPVFCAAKRCQSPPSAGHTIPKEGGIGASSPPVAVDSSTNGTGGLHVAMQQCDSGNDGGRNGGAGSSADVDVAEQSIAVAETYAETFSGLEPEGTEDVANAEAAAEQAFADADPEAVEAAPRQTAVIEQCVAWGGEQRVRFHITLACAGEPGMQTSLCCSCREMLTMSEL